jgi:hypothetical protein
VKTFASWLWFILISLAVSACSIPEPGQLVVISKPPAFRPKTPQEVKSLEDAIAAVMTVCTKDLGLPVIEPYYLHLYKDANAYAAYTYGFARMDQSMVRLTWAQPQETRLHVNLERLGGVSWGTLLRFLAHEYAHNIEDVVIGGTHGWNQWIREGFADWVAAKVMDSLGWESYASSLARTERALARHGASLPKFSELEQTRQWVRVVDRPKGKIQAYGLALLAVHRLIEKKGVAGMREYFRSENFSASFGLSWGDFEREMEGVVKDLVARNTAKKSGLKAEPRPEWKSGYQWQYAVKGLGARGRSTNEVVREEIFDGVPAYILRLGANDYIHTKDTLALSATLSGGKTITKNSPPLLWLSWPLAASKEWRNTSVVENLEQKSSQRMDVETVVAGVEEILVPAGRFEAYRIETYNFHTGELMFEQWYAPRVKWVVKSKDYRQEGVIEQELQSFKID